MISTTPNVLLHTRIYCVFHDWIRRDVRFSEQQTLDFKRWKPPSQSPPFSIFMRPSQSLLLSPLPSRVLRCMLSVLLGGGCKTRRNPVSHSPRALSCGTRCMALTRQRLSDDLVWIKSSGASRAPVWHLCLITESHRDGLLRGRTGASAATYEWGFIWQQCV